MGGSIVQLILALYLATVLSFKVKGGNVFKGFMFFPYLINGIAIGFIFKFFYNEPLDPLQTRYLFLVFQKSA